MAKAGKNEVLYSSASREIEVWEVCDDNPGFRTGVSYRFAISVGRIKEFLDRGYARPLYSDGRGPLMYCGPKDELGRIISEWGAYGRMQDKIHTNDEYDESHSKALSAGLADGNMSHARHTITGHRDRRK